MMAVWCHLQTTVTQVKTKQRLITQKLTLTVIHINPRVPWPTQIKPQRCPGTGSKNILAASRNTSLLHTQNLKQPNNSNNTNTPLKTSSNSNSPMTQLLLTPLLANIHTYFYCTSTNTEKCTAGQCSSSSNIP